MIQAAKVKELDFLDLYLGHPRLADRFSDATGRYVNPLLAGLSLREDLDSLIAACRATLKTAPLAADLKVEHDGLDYWVSVMPAEAGPVFVVRKVAGPIQSMSELGIPPAFVSRLMSKSLSGLLVVSGGPKAGKTTSACALVKDRLATYGGIAMTAEERIELPLEGSYGPGICFQTTMPPERRDIAKTIRQLERCGARILVIDEIRDERTAVEVLLAGMGGNLIISTMLAESIEAAICKLQLLANQMLPADAAQSLLADGLAGVLHQHLARGVRTQLEAQLLSLKDVPTTRAALRKGKFETLGGEIHRQITSMIAGVRVHKAGEA